MFARSLANDSHRRHFTVRMAPRTGWEVRDEFDTKVLKSTCYKDWHRVERAKAMFALEAMQLKDRGWKEL